VAPEFILDATWPVVPPKNVVRSDWLDSITSIFGYDQRIKLPSCFVDVALKTASDDLNPFTPGAFDVGQALRMLTHFFGWAFAILTLTMMAINAFLMLFSPRS
jgi:hypothetical protein